MKNKNVKDEKKEKRRRAENAYLQQRMPPAAVGLDDASVFRADLQIFIDIFDTVFSGYIKLCNETGRYVVFVPGKYSDDF